MRRKSERNKTKGSPEKKVEKPTTRRTTRRRGKAASPEASPDREAVEETSTVTSTPYSDDDKDSKPKPEEQSNDKEEAEKGVSSTELIKSVLGAEEEDNGSVWKVSRADASPGEIQKLKLCRQRNISETSDSPLNKKKSNKWPDGGDGGTEEADSADDQIASSQKMFSSQQSDDPSSLHPGQDSNEEVSDYKENLPETTSANLSDDKTNIDQQADSKENLPETTLTNLSEHVYEDNQSSNLSSNLPGEIDNVAEHTPETLSHDQQNEDNQGNSNDPDCFGSIATDSNQFVDTSIINKECNTSEAVLSSEKMINDDEKLDKVTCREHSLPDQEQIVPRIEPVVSFDEEAASYEGGNTVEENSSRQDPILDQEASTFGENNVQTIDSGSSDTHKIQKKTREVQEKEPSSESDSNVKDESDTQDTQDEQSPVVEIKSQKHDEYHEPSSDSNESDEEQQTMENDETKEKDFDTKENIKKNRREKKNTNQLDSDSKVIEPELELSESNLENQDILEITEKSDDLNVSLSSSKPAKVSLKRSFSSHLSSEGDAKNQGSNRRPDNKETNQNKENHADNDQPDKRSATRRRRWGTTTSTDVAPAFSISTDSLKALVPGAKPLSVNEVRLTKDEDEKERRKSKRDSSGDHKQKNDAVSKSDAGKKGDAVMDNHTAHKRKITLVKETPRPASPSLPEAQATNILLIRNLVRPFTLNQIKELLSRTGTIVENGFWMDRIKSKCYVEYANEDQAFETRQALHGVSWPLSNPKKLIVEYSTKEDMELAQEMSKDQPTARKTEPLHSTDLWQQDSWSRDERSTALPKITIVREWDLGKEDDQLHVKAKEKERKELERKKRQRSRSPITEAHLPPPARKFKKKEEEPPTAKLLDDLFRKTKATPCIYWLPLTNEQIIVKEEMRRQHMAEHARRLEEMRRVERNRDPRRRRSPRK